MSTRRDSGRPLAARRDSRTGPDQEAEDGEEGGDAGAKDASSLSLSLSADLPGGNTAEQLKLVPKQCCQILQGAFKRNRRCIHFVQKKRNQVILSHFLLRNIRGKTFFKHYLKRNHYNLFFRHLAALRLSRWKKRHWQAELASLSVTWSKSKQSATRKGSSSS